MAKILVADDNSNIQKMVGLALKDQGIDVVAVGNGEAAVRKISDVRPDLVLADVFMPVRNGYEVCQYVKTDSALAHIPVILLVGAFDPLDEQEAQRVGADGVLKKPFVPPDPLISMVKSALARAGVAHASSAEKTPEPESLKATDLLGPRGQTVPTVNSIPVQMAPQEDTIAALGTESFVDEIPARPEPLKIDAGSQAVAFGSLLDTPADEVEVDPGFLPPVHPELATERDWRDPDVEETTEEEEEKPAAKWRLDGAEEAGAGAQSNSAAKDWRAGSFEQIQARRNQIEDWEPAEEKPEAVEAANTAREVSPSALPKAPPTVPASPFAAEAWAAVTGTASQNKAPEDTVTELEEVVHTSSYEQSPYEQTAAEEVLANTQEVTRVEPEKKPFESSEASTSSSPWDAEIQKANQLASAWDSGVPATAPAGASKAAEKTANAAGKTAKGAIEEGALPAAAVEAIREEAAQVAEDVAHAAAKTPSGESGANAKVGAAEAPESSMDDLVARVLAKMSPDVLQAVTREILKPVVEAMVKEEMKPKKS